MGIFGAFIGAVEGAVFGGLDGGAKGSLLGPPEAAFNSTQTRTKVYLTVAEAKFFNVQ